MQDRPTRRWTPPHPRPAKGLDMCFIKDLWFVQDLFKRGAFLGPQRSECDLLDPMRGQEPAQRDLRGRQQQQQQLAGAILQL